MRRVVPFLIMAAISVPAVAGPARSTEPYEAVIEANGVAIHSGPGRNYYVTGELKKGDRVNVHRHDLGGWYMIAPPPGSFSWIAADAVERKEGSEGILKSANIPVHVGSSLSDDHHWEQVRLSTGDRVEVIGEAMLNGPAGAVRFLKIKPPKFEWRWIEGKYVVPADDHVRKQQDRDPFTTPSQAKRTAAKQVSAEVAQQSTEAAGGPQLVGSTEPQVDIDQITVGEHAVQELDAAFSAMVDEDPTKWDIDGLEIEYRRIQDATQDRSLIGLISMRLDAVEKYRKIKSQYDEYVAFTSQTADRDAQLAAQQQALQQQNNAPSVYGSQFPMQSMRPMPGRPMLMNSLPWRRNSNSMQHQMAMANGRFNRPMAPQMAYRTPGVSPNAQMYAGMPGRSTPMNAVGAPMGMPQAMPQPMMAAAPQMQSIPMRDAPQPAARSMPNQWNAATSRPVEMAGYQAAPNAPVLVPQAGAPRTFNPQGAKPITPEVEQQILQTAAESETVEAEASETTGILQRVSSNYPNLPQHLLMKRDGQVIAFLQGPNQREFDKYAGQTVTVVGSRIRRPDFRAEVISVESIEPTTAN